ncbi:MAG: ribonuclease T2 [Pseudomonadota bacterium]
MESGKSTMRLIWAVVGIVACLGAAKAQDRAGAFDYYVLALSWNASWCRAEGDARNAEQCDPRYDLGFVLHGLWPQSEDDWPEYCRAEVRDPSRRETGAQADLYGSGGLAWHQWKKHGRCSGLSSRQYFALAREAYKRVSRPALLRQLSEPVRIDPDVVEDAFLEENQWLTPESVRVTCRDGLIREVRICLDRGLEPRACSRSVQRHCPLDRALLPPMR